MIRFVQSFATMPAQEPAPLLSGSPSQSIRAGAPTRSSLLTLGVLAVVCVAFISMAALTWRAWPDPLVDFGRELHMAWSVSQGSVLYRDITHLHGPLSVYVSAAMFSLFGVGAERLFALNALVLVLMLAGLARLLWLGLRNEDDRDRTTRTVAVGAAMLLLIGGFAFSQSLMIGNYNFLAPYSHELTHGLALSVGAMLAAQRWTRSRSSVTQPVSQHVTLIVCGLLTGLTFLTRAEVFVACIAGVSALLLVSFTKQMTWSRRIVSLCVWLGSALLLVVVAALWLRSAMPWSASLHGVAGTWGYLLEPAFSGSPFRLKVSGFDRAGEHLTTMGLWLLIDGAMVLLAIVWSITVARLSRDRPSHVRRWAMVMAMGVVVLACVTFASPAGTWSRTLRPMPVVLLFATAYFGWCAIKRRSETDAVVTALCAMGLALLPKVLLKAGPEHYGFAHALPGAAVLAVLAIHHVGRVAASRFGGDRAAATVVMLALLLGVTAGQVRVTQSWMSRKEVALSSGSDAMHMQWHGRTIAEATAWLGEHAESGQTLVVVPEGAMINYLSRLRNPTRFDLYLPDWVQAFEQQMTHDWSSAKPDWVVWIDRDTSELGSATFGQTYAPELGRILRDEYEPRATLGPEKLRAIVYERKRQK
jgi:hypothetical protein